MVPNPPNLCGTCREPWPACKCSHNARTESIYSLLSSPHLFSDPDKRHLCAFFYHSYLHWTPRSNREDFSAACLPPWEGWYAGWIKLDNILPNTVPWSEHLVMQCSLHYYDGTKLGAYIDSTGRLIANVPGAPTPNEVDYDPDRHLVRTTVTMTQALTQAEIKSGRRGNVHGGSNLPNNGRKVSHIVQESQTGRYEVCLLPRDVAQHSQHVMVQQDRLWNFSPHMGHEFKIRNRRRYSKDVAKHVQRFIKAAFIRAELDDHAARFALQRAWQLSVPKPQELLESTATNLANLLAVSSNAKERQEKHTNPSTK